MIESSKLKKIVLVAIVIIILIGVYFLFIAPMLENDTIPECDIVIEYTGKSGPYSDDMGYVGLTKNVEEIRDKVGEDSNYIYYNDKGTYSNYTIEGHFSLNLTENNTNGSSKDLEFLKSAFGEIENNSRLSSLDTDNCLYSVDDLNNSAFDGANAYLTFYNKNGDAVLTKKLDNFFFTCYLNPFYDNDTYRIEFGNYDVQGFNSIISNDDLDTTVEFCMILNSSSGETYELKLPLEFGESSDEKTTTYI